MANINSMNVGGQLSMTEDTAAREMEANAYDSTQTYEKEDICIYNDKLYEANTAIATPEAFNIAHWTETTLGKIAQKHRDSISKLTEKCTISYEEVEFEEKIGQGHTPAGDVKVSVPNHDSKILVGAKIVDYDGAITINCILSTPVLSSDRSNWSIRIVNLSAAETTVKGKLIFTYLG